MKKARCARPSSDVDSGGYVLLFTSIYSSRLAPPFLITSPLL